MTSVSNLYGANRALISLIQGLTQYGVQSFVIFPHPGPLVSELQKNHVPFFIFPFMGWVHGSIIGFVLMPFKIMLNILTLPFIYLRIIRWNADLIYSNTSDFCQGWLIAKCMKKCHVWHIREFLDMDYELRLDFGRRIMMYMLLANDITIAVSNAVKNHYPETVREKIHVAYDGGTVQPGADGIESGKILKEQAASSNFTFAIVGYFHRAKGQDQAIRAFSRVIRKYSGVRLIIAGDGSAMYRRRLMKMVRKYELGEYVKVLGYVSNPLEVFSSVNTVLICSTCEAFGLVTIEAMSVGRPVIGRATGGTAEIITDGITGLLYDGSDDDLCACMEKVIRDPLWAFEMGINGQKRICEDFSREKCIRQMFQLLSGKHEIIS